jgi:diguanylate cyclase (GGDEF)-like protein
VLLSERLLESVRDLNVEHAGRAIKLTVSVGVAQVNAGETPEAWLQRADQALYEAKNGGRDRVACAGASESPHQPAA